MKIFDINRYILLFIFIFPTQGMAYICPTPPLIKAVGIGDGCTIKSETTIDGETITLNAAWIPHIYAFKDLFTPSCDRHDRCLITIGNGTSGCNSAFFSDLKSACEKKYSLLQPVERSTCLNTATNYYAAVELAQKDKLTKQMQRDNFVNSKNIENSINTYTCATTPSATALYNPSAIDAVNGIFMTYAKRLPSIYEFFAVMNYGISTNAEGKIYSAAYIDDKNSWNNNAVNYATAAGKLPLIELAIGVRNFEGGVLYATPDLSSQNIKYVWKINGISWSGPEMYFADQPSYGKKVLVQGFVATFSPEPVPTRSKNIAIINREVYLRGFCDAGACN